MKSPLFLFLLLSILSCKKASELPQVITKEAINNETYLTLAGEVISTGDDVTTRGICWSENAIPTVDDEWKLDGSRGLGDFTINIEDCWEISLAPGPWSRSKTMLPFGSTTSAA